MNDIEKIQKIIIECIENKRIEKDITKYQFNKLCFGSSKSAYNKIVDGIVKDITLKTVLKMLEKLNYSLTDLEKDIENHKTSL